MPSARQLYRELLAYAQQARLVVTERAGRVHGEGDESVLFVHGHGAGPGAFDPMARALGARRFAAFRYGMTGSVRHIAADLGRFATSHLGPGPIHVVAHSMGGILARVWLQELAPPEMRERVRSLVTLSTAHRGIRVVPGARVLPLVRELLPGHDVIRRLAQGGHLLRGIRGLSVVSSWDHFVPAAHAHFDGAEIMTVDDAGHVGVLFQPRVHARIAGLLASHRVAPLRKAG